MGWPEDLAAARQRGESAVLATVVEVRGHAPRDVGAAMVVTASALHGSIGGGNLEEEAVTTARAMLEEHEREPRELALGLTEQAPTVHGRQCCGGAVRILLAPVHPRPCVALFGIGHVGEELARLLARLDVHLVLVDSRPARLHQPWLQALASDPSTPAAVELRHAPVPEAELSALPAGAHVLVLTHDHAEDIALVDQALRRPVGALGSLGLIGSAAKWARFRRRLRREGHDDAALARVTCPVGLPEVVGKDPVSIAVGVTAALLPALAGARPISSTSLVSQDVS